MFGVLFGRGAFVCLVLSLLAPRISSAVVGNLLVNGDFETVPIGLPVSLDGVTPIPGGSTALPGWTATGGSVDHLRGNYWQNASGACSMDLDGNQAIGGLTQSFATNIGETYQVVFSLAGNPDPSNELIKKLRVTAASLSIDYTFDITGKTHANMGWIQESFTFNATSSLSTLAFTSMDLDLEGRGPAIDNVSVVSTVPEPGLGILLVVCVLAAARRRLRA